MDICCECNNDNETIEKLKYEMNFCLMKVGESIFKDLYAEKNEYRIKKILINMLIETCEFIMSQSFKNIKKLEYIT